MVSVQPIKQLPINFDEYVQEIERGLSRLYSPRAGEDYRKKAPRLVQATMAHPQVEALAAYFEPVKQAQQGAGGLLFSIVSGGVGRISFVHVPSSCAGRGVEERLVEEAVLSLRNKGVQGIVSDYVALCPLTLDACFERLGFHTLPRLLMGAPANVVALSVGEVGESEMYDRTDWLQVADIIVQAYEGHPDRDLHTEVRSRDRALEFVETAALGGFGASFPEYGRLIRRQGVPVGSIIGCEVASGVGFVLQVAVHPAYQNGGIGGQLVKELATSFRDAGLAQIALGVTAASPARRLYERLGFATLLRVNAHYWWRRACQGKEMDGNRVAQRRGFHVKNT